MFPESSPPKPLNLGFLNEEPGLRCYRVNFLVQDTSWLSIFYILISMSYIGIVRAQGIGAVDNLYTTSRFFLPDVGVHGISILTAKRVRRTFDRQNEKEPSKRPREAAEHG